MPHKSPSPDSLVKRTSPSVFLTGDQCRSEMSRSDGDDDAPASYDRLTNARLPRRSQKYARLWVFQQGECTVTKEQYDAGGLDKEARTVL
jgi:hypothetical protein